MATFSPCYRQKKRQINRWVEFLLCSAVSQRRSARLLRVNRKTIARKLRFLALEARKERNQYFNEMTRSKKLMEAFVDEMESFEHSRAKALSIPLMVTKKRKFVGFKLATFPPPTPRLAKICKVKYGPRADERRKGLEELLKEVSPWIDPRAIIRSDKKRAYVRILKAQFPKITHKTYKGRRPAQDGHKELKEGGHDPLFPLNHTCAMLRANINRLIRNTWCTTKKTSALEDHIYVYMAYHNRVLTRP